MQRVSAFFVLLIHLFLLPETVGTSFSSSFLSNFYFSFFFQSGTSSILLFEMEERSLRSQSVGFSPSSLSSSRIIAYSFFQKKPTMKEVGEKFCSLSSPEEKFLLTPSSPPFLLFFLELSFLFLPTFLHICRPSFLSLC